MLIFAIVLMLSRADTLKAVEGYDDHEHSFTADDDCGGCSKKVSGVYYTNKKSYTSTKCTTCGGDGKDGVKCGQCSKEYATKPSQCSNCGNSSSNFTSVTCTTCSGTGYWGKCSHCNGTGVNYYCKNSSCIQGYTSYDNWKTESGYNSVCYRTPIVYTQTIHHYLWNADTAAWDYWTTTYGSGTYGTVFYPSYTTTPNGYYNYSLDWFGGWTVSGAGTFAAYYYPNTYYATYQGNGGTNVPGQQSFLFNSTVYLSGTEPTRTGYTFNNWYIPENGWTLTPGHQIPKGWGSITLQAQWTANDYNVTLVPNGGTCQTDAGENVASVTTTFGTTNYWAMTWCLPVRAGYTFLGWYDALEGGTQVYNAEGYCTNEGTYFSNNTWKYDGDVTLYAQWERNKYLITYDGNEGTTEVASKTVHYGDAVDLSVQASKDGYVFTGWSTDPNATYAMSSFIMPDLATSDHADYKDDWEVTLYAVYSVAVSDVANHTYPDYAQEKEDEVYLLVWEYGNPANYKKYPFTYEYDTNIMVYRYTLDGVNVSDFVVGMDKYCFRVVALDNAGNYAKLKEGTITPLGGAQDDNVDESHEGFEKPTEYTQTVNHYRYDMILDDWIKFDTTAEAKKANETFIPSHITPPAGYEATTITYPEGYQIASDGSYVVKEAATSRAYYESVDYVITFNPNEGTCNTTEKTITYGDYYGDLPTPRRTGYTFVGWYTQADGGSKVRSSDKYLIADNSTLFAHWQVNSYNVIYDCWTNGGTSVSAASKTFDYGTVVDLSVTADKDGWTFVGWNTNPDATSGLTSLTMIDSEVVLYAIYKKDITLTIVEKTDSGQTSRSQTKTIYNNEPDATFTLTEVNKWSDWTLLGWTTETDADEQPITGIGNDFKISDSETIYGLYTSTVTIGYDTNGSAIKLDKKTKQSFHNAFGNSIYPSLVIANGPTLFEHAFVNWNVNSGIIIDEQGNVVNTCNPGDTVLVKTNVTLKAQWDAFPELEAYNRYFTVEQAKNGDITEATLLEKVVARDKEDGTLINGSDVIVLDYDASIFTGISTDQVIEITYQAKDSFGNRVLKTTTIAITDTTARKSTTKKYVRFIGKQFFADSDGNMLSFAQGGLEDTSIWRTNANYRAILQNALNQANTNGETWVFTKGDIEKIKRTLN